MNDIAISWHRRLYERLRGWGGLLVGLVIGAVAFGASTAGAGWRRPARTREDSSASRRSAPKAAITRRSTSGSGTASRSSRHHAGRRRPRHTPGPGGCRHALTADPAAAPRPVRSGRIGGATHATTHPAQGTDAGARRPRRADCHARRAHRAADQRRPQPVEGRRLRDVLHRRLAGHEDRGGVGRRGRRRGAASISPRRGTTPVASCVPCRPPPGRWPWPAAWPPRRSCDVPMGT